MADGGDGGDDEVSVTVESPQKVVEPWGTYVSFLLRTHTRRWGDATRDYAVRRRYNDFKALRERLVEASLQVVPPLPSAHTLIGQLDRYSKEFVLQRMALLNIFMKRLASHSILTHNNDLKVFLTASTAEFALHFKSKAGYLSTISDSLCNLAAPNAVTNITSLSSRSKDAEFSSISNYMTSLHEKLGLFNAVSARVVKERSDISTEAKSIKPILDSWSQTERFNRDTLKTTCRKMNDAQFASNENFPLGDVLRKMARPFFVISSENYKLVKEYPYIIINPIKEYILYVEAVKDKLSKRDGLQASLEGAREKLTKKKERTAYEGANANNEASSQLPKLSQDVEDSHDRLQCAAEALRSDLCSWQIQKRIDLKMLLVEMAKRHIEFYEKSLSTWEMVLIGQTDQKNFVDDMDDMKLSPDREDTITVTSELDSSTNEIFSDICI